MNGTLTVKRQPNGDLLLHINVRKGERLLGYRYSRSALELVSTRALTAMLARDVTRAITAINQIYKEAS